MGLDVEKMPLYRSHKEVRALEISQVDRHGVDYKIFFTDKAFEPIVVPTSFFARGVAQPQDFYVIYADGYASHSPAKAFLEGYSPVVPARVASPHDTIQPTLPASNAPPPMVKL